MPKSTKTSKIRFTKIRQTRIDYFRHFVQEKLGLVTASSFAFLFGAIFVLNIASTFAQPTATPPGGNVDGRFTSLRTNSLGTLTGTGNLTVNNTLDLKGGIINTGTANAGAISFNEKVIVNGNTTTNGILNTGKLMNAGDLEVRGKFGNYVTITEQSNYLQREYNVVMSGCPTDYTLISCDGIMTNNPSYNFAGTVKTGVCISAAQKTNNTTTSTINLSSQATCFRSY